MDEEFNFEDWFEQFEESFEYGHETPLPNVDREHLSFASEISDETVVDFMSKIKTILVPGNHLLEFLKGMQQPDETYVEYIGGPADGNVVPENLLPPENIFRFNNLIHVYFPPVTVGGKKISRFQHTLAIPEHLR